VKLWTVAAAGLLSLVALPVPASATARAPVVVIVMENHSFGPNDPGVQGKTTEFIVGNADAPYINDQLIPEGTLFTNYDATGSPSLPNYLHITAGTDGGCTTNRCPFASVTVDNVFNQLGQAGIPFDSFAQSMPSNCSTTVAAPYIPHHNPELYLSDVDPSTGLSYACDRTDVPFPGSWPDPLPPFSLIVPDGCHDMHGSKTICPGAGDQIIRDGDAWLASNVPTLLGLGAVVVVTFDEGTDTDTTGGGGHVATIMAGPSVPAGGTDASPFTHDGLLAGVENYFGLPLLAGAATAAPLPIPPPTSSAGPNITGFEPQTGKPGDQVTIRGNGFTDAFSVRFNGEAAAFSVSDDGTVAATVPTGATSGPITVSTSAGTATSAGSFTVISPPAPTVSGFDPTAGAAGTSVSITGTHFSGATATSFGGVTAAFTIMSDTLITATVPSGAATGPVRVTSPGGTGMSSSSFTVTKVSPVKVADFSYNPKGPTVVEGTTVLWSFAGPSIHTATDQDQLGPSLAPLFDSGPKGPGESYGFAFCAAGVYPYASTRAEPSPMTGTIKVRPRFAPVAGGVATSFTLTWSACTMPGYGFDAQYRFRPSGSTRWGAWVSLATGQTSVDTTFAPNHGTGTYGFRSRLRKIDTGKTSGYSPIGTIAVT
jgi:plastocyanin